MPTQWCDGMTKKRQIRSLEGLVLKALTENSKFKISDPNPPAWNSQPQLAPSCGARGAGWRTVGGEPRLRQLYGGGGGCGGGGHYFIDIELRYGLAQVCNMLLGEPKMIAQCQRSSCPLQHYVRPEFAQSICSEQMHSLPPLDSDERIELNRHCRL